MTEVKNLKLLTAILETILAIPIYWWVIIISLAWSPLLIMLVLHIITLILGSNQKNISNVGSIFWIVTSILWWIPVFWMLLHIITAILLWVDYSKIISKPMKS